MTLEDKILTIEGIFLTLEVGFSILEVGFSILEVIFSIAGGIFINWRWWLTPDTPPWRPVMSHIWAAMLSIRCGELDGLADGT